MSGDERDGFRTDAEYLASPKHSTTPLLDEYRVGCPTHGADCDHVKPLDEPALETELARLRGELATEKRLSAVLYEQLCAGECGDNCACNVLAGGDRTTIASLTAERDALRAIGFDERWDDLTATNKKLRDALERILDDETQYDDDVWAIARAALKEEK